jgi:ADP-heptose:LPS heptosyltransferase
MKILWFRPDSIGDAVLANSMLPHIAEKYKNAEITAFCKEPLKELYEVNPYIKDIITFDKNKMRKDQNGYVKSLIDKINSYNFDLVLNSVYSRDPLTDRFLNCNAKEKIGFYGNSSSGMSDNIRKVNNEYYTKLIENKDNWLLELERHKEFLSGIGIEIKEKLIPIVYIDNESEKWADKFLEENKFNKDKIIILFAGVQVPIRFYDKYGIALNKTIDSSYSVIALGDKTDFDINEKNLQDITVTSKKVNLSGKTSITQASAIIKRSCLAVGAETGLAHIACALNIPNVILLGGGHYGRFMPYSEKTYIADNKTGCFRCDWICRKPSPECVKNVTPEVITNKIIKAMEDNKLKRQCIVATSIIPVNIEEQKITINSWLEKNFKIFSFNTEEELIILKKEFPLVNFVKLENSGKEKYGKPYPLLKDIFDYLFKMNNKSDMDIFGIVNSDIFLKKDIKSFLNDNITNSLLFGCRNDVNDFNDKIDSTYYKCGFDYFFFDKDLLEVFYKTEINLYMGLNWWDYILPILTLNSGKELKRIVSPIALHKKHKVSENSIDFRKDTFIDFMSILSKELSLDNTFVISDKLLNYMLDYSQLMVLPENQENKIKPIVAEIIVKSGMSISKESDFSIQMKKLLKQNKFTNILETGTYLGEGTTKIIASTLKELNLKNHNFYSIEVNPDFHKQADINLRKSGLRDYVHLINGFSVPSYLLPSKENIFNSCITEIENKNIIVDHMEEYRVNKYYNEINFNNLPYNRIEIVLEKMNNKPNIILLDSAGCMGFIEFKYLMSLLKWACYIFLDDTKHVKHYKSLEYIKQCPKFDWLYESDEKFGFCIARYIG